MRAIDVQCPMCAVKANEPCRRTTTSNGNLIPDGQRPTMKHRQFHLARKLAAHDANTKPTKARNARKPRKKAT